MWLRFGHHCVRLLAWLKASLVVILLVIAWRLATGPISLEPVTELIADALEPADGSIEVTINETLFDWRALNQGLVVTADQVRLTPKDGRASVVLPEMRVVVSLRALLNRWLLAPSVVEIRDPRLMLQRTRDGVALRGVGPTISADSPEAIEAPPPRPESDPIDLARVLNGLIATRETPDEPLHYLERISVRGGLIWLEDRVVDTAVLARAVQLDLEKDDDSDALGFRAQARMVQPASGMATVDLNGSFHPDQEVIEVSFGFGNLEPATLAPYAPDVPLEALKGNLSGTLKSDFSLQAGQGALRADLLVRMAELDLPELWPAPVPIDYLDMRVVIEPGFDVAHIRDIHLNTLDVTATGHGSIDLTDARGPDLRMEVGVENATIEAARTLWPPFAAGGAREWVMANVQQATVPRVDFAIELTPEDAETDVLRTDVVVGTFAFTDTELTYLPPMPQVSQLSGAGEFDANRLVFRGQTGTSAGVDVQSAEVVISGYADNETRERLSVQATLISDLASVLTYIDNEPLTLLQGTDFAGLAATATGATEVDLQIGFPLIMDLGLDDVDLQATGRIDDGAATNFLDLVELSQADLAVDVTTEQLKIDGEAAIDGSPMTVGLTYDFDGGAKTVSLDGQMPVDWLAERLPIAGELAKGTVGLSVSADENADGRLDFDLDADLRRAEIELVDLAARKPSGEPGSLVLRGTLANGRRLAFEQIELQSDSMELIGRATIDLESERLIALSVDRAKLGPNRGRIDVTSRDGGYGVVLEAEHLDLSHLFKPGLEDEAAAQETSERAITFIDVDLRSRAVTLGPGQVLSSVSVDGRWQEGIWQRAEIAMEMLQGNGMAMLDLRPISQGHELTVRSDDAGAFLNAIGVIGSMRGGRLDGSFTIEAQQPQPVGSGRLTVSGFSIVDAPITARVLSLASFDGISDTLRGAALQMEQLDLPFALKPGWVVHVQDAKAHGSSIGLTMNGTINTALKRLNVNGTIVPAYAINHLIGEIPLVGRFLRGQSGSGAFAVTYQVNGAFSDPAISVNPLSVLAPGTIRDLFAQGEPVGDPDVSRNRRDY
ncbi:MAG: AsmA-like C-terminal region-containing protein [Geminicoccaceae bacterium]